MFYLYLAVWKQVVQLTCNPAVKTDIHIRNFLKFQQRELKIAKHALLGTHNPLITREWSAVSKLRYWLLLTRIAQLQCYSLKHPFGIYRAGEGF